MARYLVQATWDDAPHLSEAQKANALASIHPSQRAARTRGVPYLGAGLIFPIDEADIVVPDFPLPRSWPRGYVLDVGWNRTAALWRALDRETGIRYYYAEHYLGKAEPAVHVEAILAKGRWIPGKIDPAARGRSQLDGRQLFKIYGAEGFGLRLGLAPNAVEAGLDLCWNLLRTGQIRVFQSLHNFLAEFRVYRRDTHGRVVKERDHLMDCFRMSELSGVDWLETEPGLEPLPGVVTDRHVIPRSEFGWMA